MVGDQGRVAMIHLERLADPPVVLEGPAAAIWDLVDGRRSTGAMAAELAERSGAGLEQVGRDVVAFLDDLARRGFITFTPGEDAP